MHWGTWDSNPSPIRFHTLAWPLRHYAFIVSIIDNEYYMGKHVNARKYKKNKREIMNGPIGTSHVFVFLFGTWLFYLRIFIRNKIRMTLLKSSLGHGN